MQAQERSVEDFMNPRRFALIIGVVALAAGGLGAGVALATSGGSSSPGTVAPGTTGAPSYSWYRSMMGSFGGGSMMGGSYGWMMGATGYRWMMGGTNAPNWMRGEALPGFMMGTSTDPGKVMGALFANAAGPRVSPSQATRVGNEIPAGAIVNRVARRITFAGQIVHLVVLASPAMPSENFRSAGLVNPTIVVPAGAMVSIELVNADTDMAHGLVATATGTRSSWMPMTTARPAFTGSTLWFLGEPTSAGTHAATFSFTATTPGTYEYLCPVPGHAQKGMLGTFVVTG
jgi:rusticyanin